MVKKNLKKTQTKMKKALEVTISSATKVYLIQSWSGVVALNQKLSKEKAVDTIELAGRLLLQLYF